MARTPERTRIQDFIVTNGNSVTGEDGSASAGSDLALQGGDGDGAGNAGGDVLVTGGSAGGGEAVGSAILLTAGAGSGAQAGGALTFGSGAGGATGAGGNVTFTSGAGGATSGNAGNILLTSGGVTAGSLGVVRITNTALEFIEAAAVPGPAIVATQGRLWVRDDAPNTLIFTDDAGTDHDLLTTAGATTLAEAIEAQGSGAFTGANSITWRVADTESVNLQTTASENLLQIRPTAGGDTLVLGHGSSDTLDVDTASNDFLHGLSVDTGAPDTTIAIGTSARTVSLDSGAGTEFLITQAGEGDLAVEGAGGGDVLVRTLDAGPSGVGAIFVQTADSLVASSGITVQVGESGSGSGADLTLQAGNCSTAPNGATFGGDVLINAGDSIGGSGAEGGDVLINAGDATAGGLVGGDATLAGGPYGGSVTITGAASAEDTIAGGDVTITAGDSTAVNTAQVGGSVNITSGSVTDGGSTSDAGDIVLTPGTAAGSGTDGEVRVEGKLTVTGLIDPTGLVLNEQAAVPTGPVAGEGVLWVRSDTPNVLVFTDDAGTDHDLGTGSSGFVTTDGNTPMTATWDFGDQDLENVNRLAVGLPSVNMTAGRELTIGGAGNNRGVYGVVDSGRDFLFHAAIGGSGTQEIRMRGADMLIKPTAALSTTWQWTSTILTGPTTGRLDVASVRARTNDLLIEAPSGDIELQPDGESQFTGITRQVDTTQSRGLVREVLEQQTTGGLQTVAWSFTLATDPSAIMVHVVLHAHIVGGGARGGFERRAVGYRDGQPAAIEGSVVDLFTQQNSTWDVTIGVDTNDVRVLITGEAETIDWTGYVEYQLLG